MPDSDDVDGESELEKWRRKWQQRRQQEEETYSKIAVSTSATSTSNLQEAKVEEEGQKKKEEESSTGAPASSPAEPQTPIQTPPTRAPFKFHYSTKEADETQKLPPAVSQEKETVTPIPIKTEVPPPRPAPVIASEPAVHAAASRWLPSSTYQLGQQERTRAVEKKPVSPPPTTTRIRGSLLSTDNKRILQARIVGMILAFIGALLLLSYSLYFFYVFETFNNTTSYFPWAWLIGYNNRAVVAGLTTAGVIVSVFFAGISLVAARFFRGMLRKVGVSQPSSSRLVRSALKVR